MAGGRPTKYEPKVAEAICEMMIAGEGLVKICARPGMPGRSTVHRWLNEHQEFRDTYARARELQADFYAEECIQIADDDSQDILDIGETGDKRMITNSAAVARARERINARKWAASQMAPKKWGQQLTQTEISGKDGGPLEITVNVLPKKPKNAEG